MPKRLLICHALLEDVYRMFRCGPKREVAIRRRTKSLRCRSLFELTTSKRRQIFINMVGKRG